LGALFFRQLHGVFEENCDAAGFKVGAPTQQEGAKPANWDLHSFQQGGTQVPAQQDSTTTQSSLFQVVPGGQTVSSGLPLSASEPAEKFQDIASFLRETGHEIVKLKERMLAGGLHSKLSRKHGAESEVVGGTPGAAWTLFERAYESCEKVFCDENEGLSKARVLGRLLDPKSTWDFILVAHPERLSIAAGYVIHTGEFRGTKFSIAEYVWVDPEYRRSGLGGCFVDYMMQELRDRGIDIHFGEIKDPCFQMYSSCSLSNAGEVGFNPLHQFLFWQKQGRLLVDTMWPQPALLANEQESFAEQLTALPLRGRPTGLSPEFILAVWDAKYGVQNWEGSEAEELGISETRKKLDTWLGAFAADSACVQLMPLNTARRWTLEEFASNH
jgi:GNAT superfamily N-acetyltransferase